MYSKRQRKRHGIKRTRKRHDIKKGGGTPPAKRRRLSTMTMSPDTRTKSTYSSPHKSIWKTRLTKNNQILCKKFYPNNTEELANSCYKYNEKLWIKNKYGMKDITEEASPLFIFHQDDRNSYETIQDGIHNFMLFWDDIDHTYTLVTAFFNPFEFGNKHNIISLRTVGKTPDTFIISGEIKKNGPRIKFHDISSQYFQNNPCNIKRQIPVIYIYDLIQENDLDIENITPEQLARLKEMLFENNEYDINYKRNITKTQNIKELMDEVQKYFPMDKRVIYKNYVDLIEAIVEDAFEIIFKEPAVKVTYVPKFTDDEYKEYEQQNVKKFTEDMCRLSHPIPFDVYFNSKTCENNSNKSTYNSCQIAQITDDYRIQTLGAKTPATVKPQLPTLVKITTPTSVILLTQADLERSYGWFLVPAIESLNRKLTKNFPPPATITYLKENFAIKYHNSIDANGHYIQNS